MPTRKQRRRRDKSFRHEYETVLVDEEGNETPLAELRTREPKKEKPRAAAAIAKGGKGRRPVREVQPPSWRKALRRGGLMGGLMLVLFALFLSKGAPLASRIGIGLLYAVAFVPLTYYTDRMAYRSYLKRSGQLPAPTPKK